MQKADVLDSFYQSSNENHIYVFEHIFVSMYAYTYACICMFLVCVCVWLLWDRVSMNICVHKHIINKWYAHDKI